MGGDVAEGNRCGVEILTYMNTKSQIDAVELKENSKPIDMETFKGEIEFRDVWFRYPTRKNQWVFKGLNLTIPAGNSIGIVGESGCGKSTFISLVLRFYDPQFGQILLDGVDIKELNVKTLRKTMGFVMQEPVLFNYTVLENILYGNDTATNSEVREAVRVANAEFIENQTFDLGYEDSADSLLSGYRKEKEGLIALLGQEKYDN